jgi:hypothetical protein
VFVALLKGGIYIKHFTYLSVEVKVLMFVIGQTILLEYIIFWFISMASFWLVQTIMLGIMVCCVNASLEIEY